MDDAEFAALERRLADGSATWQYAQDVQTLLAECRRLREPPDVSGLMPAAEVEALRGRWAADWPGHRTGSAQYGQVVDKDLSALLGHADAQAALIRELYGVVADLHADDPGRQALLGRGAAEMLCRVLALVRESFGDPAAADYPELADTLGRLRALGPARPPLPPSEEAREAGRLREVLRPLVAFCDYCHGGERWRGKPVPALNAADLDAARAALGEPLT